MAGEDQCFHREKSKYRLKDAVFDLTDENWLRINRPRFVMKLWFT